MAGAGLRCPRPASQNETDEARRQTILQLLAAEQAKLAEEGPPRDKRKAR